MIKVLDIHLFDRSIPHAIQLIIEKIGTSEKISRCISATGAHGIVYATKNPYFKATLSEFFINLPDGMPGVWIGRLKGAKEMKRCYGPDFFRDLLTVSSTTHIKHFFCGGKEGVANELKQRCGEKFNNHNIVGTFCPPFREMNDEELILLANEIEKSGADIVWIGLSTPKQEKFAKRLSNFVKTHFIITVGAAFDFHTDKVKQAPTWLQKLGLEWFFRLCMEPKRLYKRYFEIVPLFIYYNLKEFLYYYTTKKAS